MVNALVDVHLNWLSWFHFLIRERGLLVILIDCAIFFFSLFLDFTRMSMSTVSFLAQQGSGILLIIECIPLTYDLNDFKSRLTDTFFNCRFFLGRFPVCSKLLRHHKEMRK